MIFKKFFNETQLIENVEIEFQCKVSEVDIRKGGWISHIGSDFDMSSRIVEYVDEAIAPEQYGLDKFKGGMIIFSTDVNAVNQDIKNVITRWFRNKWDTTLNRMLRVKKLDAIIAKFQKEHPGHIGGAYSIGNFFKGRYVSGENVFNEKSISIEILGIPSELLVPIATEIAREFKQETVLVKDWEKNKFFLVDRN